MRLAVLISGTGSNMVAIARACQSGQVNAEVVLVVSDVSAAAGLARAQSLGVATAVVDRSSMRTAGKPDREMFEKELAIRIDASGADIVVLAGFMRVLSAGFVARYEGRMLNIHPSLLPLYPGLDTHARVLAAGDSKHGVSVHFVTSELDGGPVVAQSMVPVLPGDDSASLSARVHAREHILYPMVIEWLAARRLQWNHGSPVLDGAPLAAPFQLQ